MAEVNPPYCLQAEASLHPAQLFRQAISTLISAAGGLVSAGALAISQKATPNMSVEILGGKPTEGSVWVPGTTSAGIQGLYYCYNSATRNLAIEASGATNPRVDTIIARVYDQQYAGAQNEWKLESIKGAEEAGVTLANLKGIGVVPASSFVLGYVLVPAKATTIVTADIANVGAPMKLAALTATTTGAYASVNFTKVEAEAGFVLSATRPVFVAKAKNWKINGVAVAGETFIAPPGATMTSTAEQALFVLIL